MARQPGAGVHRVTSHLSYRSLTINRLHPLLRSSTLRDNNASLIYYLTSPDIVVEPDGDTLRAIRGQSAQPEVEADRVCFSCLGLVE